MKSTKTLIHGGKIMLHKEYITKLLDLEYADVENLLVDASRIEIHLRLERRTCECPACGALTDAVHDYRTQRVKDIPVQGKPVVLIFRKRRYRCTSCGKRFYEKNCLLPRWHRITNRLAFHAMDCMKTNRSRKDIARDMNVSPSTMTRWLRLMEYGKPSRLPKVLSIDEFKGNTEYGKFQGILTDPEHHRVLDILPTCKESEFYEYLRAFPNRNDVRFFVMDMRREYARLGKLLFPNAKIVIDKFHVVRYACWALENVRKRIQKKLLPEQRKYFKRSRKLLLAHMADLSAESKLAVERMLLFDRDLREAYLLKEKFYDFMASSSSHEAKQRLRAFRLYASLADLPEFASVLTMLQNWEPYILNAFDCPYSNGFTEGSNNRIKAIKRTAFGYRSFHNFRARILATFHANGS